MDAESRENVARAASPAAWRQWDEEQTNRCIAGKKPASRQDEAHVLGKGANIYLPIARGRPTNLAWREHEE